MDCLFIVFLGKRWQALGLTPGRYEDYASQGTVFTISIAVQCVQDVTSGECFLSRECLNLRGLVFLMRGLL